MKEERLFEILGEVDETLIDSVAEPPAPASRKSPVWLKWGAVAACLALVLAIGVGVYAHYDKVKLVYPADNTPCQSTGGMAEQYSGNYRDYSYAELAQCADVIVCADVTDASYTHGADFPILYAHVRVRDVLKGDVQAGDTLCVWDSATGYYGEDKTLDTVSCLGLRLEKGNRVVLFLKHSETSTATVDGEGLSYYISFGDRAGKLFYDIDGKYHCSILYNNAPLDDRPPWTSYIMRDYEPKTLEEIKMLIAE